MLLKLNVDEEKLF